MKNFARFAKRGGSRFYRAEPYVTPGNVDGPGIAHARSGGVDLVYGVRGLALPDFHGMVLGIRPTWEGLLIRPCLPPDWKEAKATRQFRGGPTESSSCGTRNCLPEPIG
jgi:cellobiose phosphorylase